MVILIFSTKKGPKKSVDDDFGSPLAAIFEFLDINSNISIENLQLPTTKFHSVLKTFHT